jgi:hypothetical protein
MSRASNDAPHLLPERFDSKLFHMGATPLQVLDTGSGQVYYWHLGTNEVVWEVPAGFDADDLIPPETEEPVRSRRRTLTNSHV